MSVWGPLWTSDLVSSAQAETAWTIKFFKVQRAPSTNWSNTREKQPRYVRPRANAQHDKWGQSQERPYSRANSNMDQTNAPLMYYSYNQQRLVVNGEQHRNTPLLASHHSAAALPSSGAALRCSHHIMNKCTVAAHSQRPAQPQEPC